MKRTRLRLRDLPPGLRKSPPLQRQPLIPDGGRFHTTQRAHHLEASTALLAQHFGIVDADESARLKALVVRLAQELGIPAFSGAATSNRGRKRKWTARELRALYGHVEWLRRLGMTRDKALMTTGRLWPRYALNSVEAQVQLYHRACKLVRQSPPQRAAIESVVAQAAKAAAEPSFSDRMRSLLNLAR